MKKYDKKFIRLIIVIGVISLIIPLLIHISFTKESPEGSWIIAKWEAGDILSYCGSIIGSIIVVITVWYTLKTSKEDTKQSIETSRKQFTVDLAMSSFMEYADAFSYEKFDNTFTKEYTDKNFKTTLDEVYAMQINMTESQKKAYFHLTEKEQQYMDKHTPNVEKIGELLDEVSSILNDKVNFDTLPSTKYLTQNEYNAKGKDFFLNYGKKVEEIFNTALSAHDEILEHLKKIINNRLHYKDESNED